MSVHDSRMRRFHDCLDAATEAHIDEEDEHLFAVAILEQLADGCRQMGLPQAWCARVAGGRILYDLCDGVKAVWLKGSKP